MKRNQRGDTLIEVLIAITVLGIIVAGVMATMNRSMVSIHNSAERTASRADINTQTDLINYIFRNDQETWDKIMNLAYAGGSDGSVPTNVTEVCKLNAGGKVSDKTPGSFYLNPITESDGGVSGVELRDNLTEKENGANQTQRAIPGQGIWIDAVYYPQSATNQRSYVDFYIKACWVPFGGSKPEANSRSVTVNRIYDYVVDDNTAYTPTTPPIVTSSFNHSTNVITFNWTAPTCPAGTTPNYQYKQGSSSWIPTTATNATWTISAAGDYKLEVRATCGTFGSWGPSGVSTYTAAAVAAPSAPAPSYSYTLSSNTLTFNWGAVSCPSGQTKLYQYKKGSSGDWTATTSTSVAWAVTATGNYTLQVQARCGILGIWSGSGSSTYTTPTAPSSGPAVTHSFDGTTLTFNWTPPSHTCPDGMSMQYQYQKNDTGSWTITTARTLTGWTVNATGSYKLSVQARCGDYGSWGSSGSSTYATPAAPNSPNINTPTLNGTTMTVSWSAPSPACTSTPVEYQYSTNGGSSWTTTTNTSFSMTISLSTTYTIQVRARCSSLGAWSTPPSSVTYTADTTLPTVSATNSTGTAWKNVDIGAVVTATDSESGLGGVRYSIGSNPFTNLATCKASGTATSHGATLTIGTTGGTTLYLCAYDKADNYKVWSGAYNIDKTAPTCTNSGGNTAWTNGNRTLTGTCADTGGSGCTGNVTKAYSANINSTAESPGVVKDNAGNSTTCSANQTVRIEKSVSRSWNGSSLSVGLSGLNGNFNVGASWSLNYSSCPVYSWWYVPNPPWGWNSGGVWFSGYGSKAYCVDIWGNTAAGNYFDTGWLLLY